MCSLTDNLHRQEENQGHFLPVRIKLDQSWNQTDTKTPGANRWRGVRLHASEWSFQQHLCDSPPEREGWGGEHCSQL